MMPGPDGAVTLADLTAWCAALIAEGDLHSDKLARRLLAEFVVRRR